MTRRRRIVLLGGAAVLVLAGVLVVGYLPSRVDGGVEPAVRRVLAWLQALGAPAWVDYDLADFVANIAFFVPIGLLAALLLPWRMWWLAIPVGALLSGALEFGQYLFLPERYASWSDVLANSIGALLGALIGAAIRATRHRRTEPDLRRPEAAPRPAPPAAPR
ncbi:MAG: VanZ family protein [Pseudolysinimonas sp.]